MREDVNSIKIHAVDPIPHVSSLHRSNTASAFVVRFDAQDALLDPFVIVAASAEEAGNMALEAIKQGYPYLGPGVDPLFFWLQAREALRVMLMLETARTRGPSTSQLRRLRRAQAIDLQLTELSDAFEGPALTKKSRAKVLRGEFSGLAYERKLSPLETLDFAYTEDDRRAALLVCGAPYQPIDVVGLSLEFAGLLRQAQLYEARMIDRAPKQTVASESEQRADTNATAASASDELLWVNAKEAARRLGLSKSYLAQLRTKGGGPRFRRFGRAVRYQIKDLNEWAASKTQSSTSEVSHVR